MQEILKDCFYFPEALDDNKQQELISLYLENKDKYYSPKVKGKYGMSLSMNCFGKHWSAEDYKYYDKRVDHDNLDLKAVPKTLLTIASEFTKLCFPLHTNDWDICLSNFYTNEAALGMHIDNSESKTTLKSGHPVVSISVGSSCIFQIGGNKRQDVYTDVQLNSGDVFIFGNESRLRYHGVSKILDRDDVKLGGRLNFTLRKY